MVEGGPAAREGPQAMNYRCQQLEVSLVCTTIESPDHDVCSGHQQCLAYHSTVEERVGSFQVLAFMISAAENILVHAFFFFVNTCMCLYLVYTQDRNFWVMEYTCSAYQILEYFSKSVILSSWILRMASVPCCC